MYNCYPLVAPYVCLSCNKLSCLVFYDPRYQMTKHREMIQLKKLRLKRKDDKGIPGRKEENKKSVK